MISMIEKTSYAENKEFFQLNKTNSDLVSPS